MTRTHATGSLRGRLVGCLAVALTCSCGAPPGAETEGTRIEEVYPSGDRLPANQLKLYVEFSAPMTTRAPYDYLRLVDESSGERQEAVFHALRDGLWDPEGRRLTVIFDPGRIKRGLTNHEALGLPLEAGRAYRLELSGDWPDATGRPIGSSHIKRFTAAAADRLQPTASEWSVITPDPATRTPLLVEFGEPLDAAVLAWALSVFGPDGERVPVETRVGEREESCELWPERPWRSGRYRLEVDPRLEDLAGNNFERLFDADLTATPTAPPSTRLEFEIGGSATTTERIAEAN